jgi:hypothetical protein
VNILRLSAIAALAVAVSACCTPRVVTQEVKVAIPTPCIKELPKKPDMPLESSSASEDQYTKTKKAIAQLYRDKAYQQELEAALTACLDPNP